LLAGEVVVLYFDTFAIQILLAQEAKSVSVVKVAKTNTLLNGRLALLLPDNVCNAYVSMPNSSHTQTPLTPLAFIHLQWRKATFHNPNN